MRDLIKDRTLIKYLIVCFGITWFCWIASLLWAQKTGFVISINGSSGSPIVTIHQWIITVMFSLAVYGPLVGTFATGQLGKILATFKNKFDSRYLWFILAFPFVMFSVVMVSAVFSGGLKTESLTFSTVSILVGSFISNLVTSGQEEYGWRGFLYPYLRSKNISTWNAMTIAGTIWSVWHFPFLIYLFAPQGTYGVIVSLIGYTAGMIGATYVYNWLYQRTKNLLTAIVIHAWMNAVSVVIPLVFVSNPMVAITPHIVVWLIVSFLEKRLKATEYLDHINSNV